MESYGNILWNLFGKETMDFHRCPIDFRSFCCFPPVWRIILSTAEALARTSAYLPQRVVGRFAGAQGPKKGPKKGPGRWEIWADWPAKWMVKSWWRRFWCWTYATWGMVYTIWIHRPKNVLLWQCFSCWPASTARLIWSNVHLTNHQLKL